VFLVDQQIASVSEEFYKRDAYQVRPMVRCPSVPVRFRDHAQGPRGILGMSFSSSLSLSEEGV